MNISDIDHNLKLDTSLTAQDIAWFDVRTAPFTVYGLYNYEQEQTFRRIPESVAKATSEGVYSLHTNTAGGRVRFQTNSPYIAIKAEMSGIAKMSHMTLAGTAGFDLYMDASDESVYRASFIPPFNIQDGFESLVSVGAGENTYYTINFPLYSNVENLYIGLQAGSFLSYGKQYTFKKPMVFYGSSITQGGCASRPGNAYESIISRMLDADYINLGFSGNCKAETQMIEYMSAMDMNLFICDYDHNAPDSEWLKATHFRLYETIRKKRPDIPYVILSKPDFDENKVINAQRREIIYHTYLRAIRNNDQHVYFINGETLFNGCFRDACSVDTHHPNDLGFYRMAMSVGDVLKKICNDHFS